MQYNLAQDLFSHFANKHVPSMKPLFQRTIDILEEQNDIAYLPSIHNEQKNVIRMVLQHLIFLNCQTRTLFNVHKRPCLTRDLAVER